MEKIGEIEAPEIFSTKSAVVCDVGGQALLVCAESRSLHVFNAHTGERLVDPISGQYGIQAVKSYMIRKEAAILTGGWDGTVQFWNPRTWKRFFTIDVDYNIQDMHIDSDTLLITGDRGVVALDLNPQLLSLPNDQFKIKARFTNERSQLTIPPFLRLGLHYRRHVA